MPCYHPPQMYEQVNRTTGEVFFHIHKPVRGLDIIREFKGRCGQCVGCRASDVRKWGVRCLHESYMHEENCFLTLTVSDEHMEEVFPGGSLRYEKFQKFIRSFRKHIKRQIRFFMCGEYGERFGRPHFHSIIFGWNTSVADRQLWKRTEVGPLFTSDAVASCWKFGGHTVADFDISCAMYVAGYIQKKINGRLKDFWYKGRAQEFSKQSLKPGIGANFYRTHKREMYGRDCVLLPGGTKVPIPRYYDKLHSLYHPSHMNKLKMKRMEPNPERDVDLTPERLAARKVIHLARLKRMTRAYDQGGHSD